MSPKPLLLVFPFELLAHYLRCIGLAERLSGTCEILFQHSSSYHEFYNGRFGSFPARHFDAARAVEDSARFRFDWLNTANIEQSFLSLAEIIRRLKPDAVLGDANPALKMAAQATGVPFISLQNAYMTKYYARTRPLPPVHPLAGCLRHLPVGMAERMVRLGESLAMRQVHAPFRHLRKKYGLPGASEYLDELEGDLNLVCDCPELFPLRPLPAHYEVTGPLLHQSGERLPEFPDNGKPLLVICAGSSGNAANFEVFRQPVFARWNILTCGKALKSLAAPHIHHLDFVPLGALLKRAAVLICHGGNGTVYQAIQAGVPVLCATSHFEQDYNADAVRRAGVGDYLEKDPGAAYLQVLHWSRVRIPALARLRKALRARDLPGDLRDARSLIARFSLAA